MRRALPLSCQINWGLMKKKYDFFWWVEKNAYLCIVFDNLLFNN